MGYNATDGLFYQELTPIGGSIAGSFFVGAIPIVVVLVFLGAIRLPAYIASFIGLVVGIFISIFAWHMPAQLCFLSIAAGFAFALWPIMWIVVNAMLVYNLSVHSGLFDSFRRWMIWYTPSDRRILLLIIGFSFGALLEGVAGFGTPGAICSSLLVQLGFDPVQALVLVLLFDTTPVAFGALGVPVTTLASVTGLPAKPLSAMIGRQLPLFALFLPSYAIVILGGWRSLLTCWPASLVSGLSFAIMQGIMSNLVGPELPDVVAAIVSLICTITLVQFWKPRDHADWAAKYTLVSAEDMAAMGGNKVEKTNTTNPAADGDLGRLEYGGRPAEDGNLNQLDNANANGYEDKTELGNGELGNSYVEENRNACDAQTNNVPKNVDQDADGPQVHAIEMVGAEVDPRGRKPNLWESILAWYPWISIAVLVIIWTFVGIANYGAKSIPIQGLNNQVYLTLYNKKYAALYAFQPLATGTCILCSAILFFILLMATGHKPIILWWSIRDLFHQLFFPIITVMFIIALAYLFNYSGIAYSMGLALSSVGKAFPFLSVFLGWIACFLSGSDTSSNALFGNLQVVAARQIGLSPILMAAANSSGAVMSKMISPQNLTTGVSTIGLRGQEGKILRRTFFHSLILVSLLGALNCFEQYVIPGIIPPA
ncbi:hypothetical protein BZG36_03441 [Bifiguratus adelaidae]|uniref:Lactate permease n=1 Tax=Bifiguratus adelaidae TaxID=1938954 RepID=A0A261XXY7_9FUNG|nr:hypothetical protein BZG36_03441 [Bifiguratus adelaidae]